MLYKQVDLRLDKAARSFCNLGVRFCEAILREDTGTEAWRRIFVRGQIDKGTPDLQIAKKQTLYFIE